MASYFNAAATTADPSRISSRGQVGVRSSKLGPSGAGSDECVEDRGCGRLHLWYSTRFRGSGGSTAEDESFGRLEVTHVLRIVVLGGSICRILQGLEPPGSPTCNDAKDPSGSGKQHEHSGVGGPRLGRWGGWK